MKIAYKHLLRYIPSKPSIQELSEKLFQLGHEHEINKDIFDFEFTPNRGDCLSLLGLSRDLNVFYDIDNSQNIFNKKIDSFNFKFTNNAPEDCPKISFLKIRIKELPTKYQSYMEDYFNDLEIKKINFFTDISNYLSYEVGQPTHCYDNEKLSSGITLEKNKESCKFKTLVDEEICVEKDDLIFTINKKIVNLSGVMGGKDTACSSKTKSIILECAWFNPESIIGKSIKYNLNSDSAYKFERSTDRQCHEMALRRFIKIVQDHTEIIEIKLYKYEHLEPKKHFMEFDVSKINKILGTDIDETYYKSILDNLGFEINKKILVPSHRSDINTQNDLAEEIARVIGYDNLPSSVLKINSEKEPKYITVEEKIKSHLIKNGFSEVINFPFTDKPNKDAIKVDNPLDKNRSLLRTNLVDSLKLNLIYNENRQKDSIKIFEISDVYYYGNDNELKKEKRLAILVSGRQGHNYIDFAKKLDAKYLVNLFDEIGIDISEKILNISRDGLKSKIKNKIFAYEEHLENLASSNNRILEIAKKSKTNRLFPTYNPISEYPSSNRDLSFSLKNEAELKKLVDILLGFDLGIIKESFIFDYYYDKTNAITKLGVRYIFQSSERTLQDSEIDQIIDGIIKNALTIDSVSLPGFDKISKF